MQTPGVWLCFRHAVFFLTLPKTFFYYYFQVCVGDVATLYASALTGCLHKKPRTCSSFILGWLLDFVSRFMITGSFYIAFIWRCTSYRHIRHALPVPVYRQIDFTLKGVVVSRLRDTVAKFRSGTTTGVNSSRCDSRLHDILWVLQLVRGKQIQSCETPPWLTV